VLEALEEAPVEGYCYDASGAPIIVGKGHAAIVLLAWARAGPAALKVRRRDSKKRSLEAEARILSIAHVAGAAPEPLWASREAALMRLAPGDPLGEAQLTPATVAAALAAARALDAAGILHRELSRPWRHVIVGDREAVIVDYDSASPGCGSVNKVAGAILYRLGGLRALQEARPLLAEYRRSCERSVYEKIVEYAVALAGRA